MFLEKRHLIGYRAWLRRINMDSKIILIEICKIIYFTIHAGQGGIRVNLTPKMRQGFQNTTPRSSEWHAITPYLQNTTPKAQNQGPQNHKMPRQGFWCATQLRGKVLLGTPSPDHSCPDSTLTLGFPHHRWRLTAGSPANDTINNHVNEHSRPFDVTKEKTRLITARCARLSQTYSGKRRAALLDACAFNSPVRQYIILRQAKYAKRFYELRRYAPKSTISRQYAEDFQTPRRRSSAWHT